MLWYKKRKGGVLCEIHTVLCHYNLILLTKCGSFSRFQSGLDLVTIAPVCRQLWRSRCLNHTRNRWVSFCQSGLGCRLNCVLSIIPVPPSVLIPHTTACRPQPSDPIPLCQVRKWSVRPLAVGLAAWQQTSTAGVPTTQLPHTSVLVGGQEASGNLGGLLYRATFMYRTGVCTCGGRERRPLSPV